MHIDMPARKGLVASCIDNTAALGRYLDPRLASGVYKYSTGKTVKSIISPYWIWDIARSLFSGKETSNSETKPDTSLRL